MTFRFVFNTLEMAAISTLADRADKFVIQSVDDLLAPTVTSPKSILAPDVKEMTEVHDSAIQLTVRLNRGVAPALAPEGADSRYTLNDDCRNAPAASGELVVSRAGRYKTKIRYSVPGRMVISSI